MRESWETRSHSGLGDTCCCRGDNFCFTAAITSHGPLLSTFGGAHLLLREARTVKWERERGAATAWAGYSQCPPAYLWTQRHSSPAFQERRQQSMLWPILPRVSSIHCSVLSLCLTPKLKLFASCSSQCWVTGTADKSYRLQAFDWVVLLNHVLSVTFSRSSVTHGTNTTVDISSDHDLACSTFICQL